MSLKKLFMAKTRFNKTHHISTNQSDIGSSDKLTDFIASYKFYAHTAFLFDKSAVT